MINARNLKDLQQDAEDAGFKFQQLLVWDKGNSTPNKYYLNSFELILMLRKGRAKNINNLGTKNILRIPNIMRGRNHPTEKPADLMQVLIENSTEPGQTVLDPFMGVGGAGVASVRTGRQFIGIEIDEKYYDIAKERIERGY
jgi:site-specific DNA-methyltransferase (adenine-specific)